MSQHRIVVLREVDADRYLAIWIDPYMADQITFALQEVDVSRPMTHDLLKNFLTSLDARVVRIEVSDLRDEVYYANIVVKVNGNILDIDSRPSDALALAVRTNVPILVARKVMDAAGIVPEDDIGDENLARTELTGDGEDFEDGEERLSVFEDYIEKIDQEKGGEDEDDDEKK